MTRTSFNRGWRVRPKVSPFAQLQAGAGNATSVTLPHDAVAALPRNADAPSGGRTGYFPGGTFEYLKDFEVPDRWRGKRVTLEFQGVYRDAMVYVNGTFAAQRPSGYSPFDVPLDPFLRYGESNTIRVDARTHDDSRWYSGAGIYRDVTLRVTDLAHLGEVRIATPDIDADRAVVEVATRVVNESVETRTLRVRTEIRCPDGEVITRDSAPITLRAGGSGVVRQRLYVPNPALWSVDSPALHTARTVLENSYELLDEETTPFGIRRLQLDPITGLRINGESVKLRGACIHHDNGPLGAATIARAEERRVELLKQAGFNALRSSHNPLSPAMLDACDRLGMLVMDETFDMWAEGKSSFDYSLSFPEWWERDVESLVRKDFNHPSVIFYSIGNEIFETGDALGSEWGRALAEKIRTLDPTRFVTNGINPFVSVLSEVKEMRARSAEVQPDGEGGVNAMMNAGDFMARVSASPMVSEKTEASFSVLDVAGLNYGDGRYESDREQFPHRIIVGTETFPPRIAHNWRLVLDNAHVLGDFTWTGWDYLGEAGVGRLQYADVSPVFEAPYPWISARVGDLDITGLRRPISYYREIVFGLRTQPYLAVQRPEVYGREGFGMWAWSDSIASWSWDVPIGTPIAVEVYTVADEVELLLNGRSLGRATPGESKPFLAEFDLTYEPGELVAVGYRNGVEQGRTSLRSATGPTRLVAVADRTELHADDSDLSFITIELRDEQGNPAGAHDQLVHVTVEGAAVLQALGSARPDSEERFDAAQCTTFDGRALAIVRPRGAGEITVTVTAEGLEPVVLELESLEPDDEPVTAALLALR
ncbi:glycoside hydrolase family 2 TIM barrel-domain containing protein [Streptomyces flaveus]|uniref:Beta-galactosidase n=1 Tax=Streptomyces flaveus TaxID=66370 RepID=A0A917QYK5_9ACTN|nr:glycoside hydrolase family 2 TIM barrel-domain containing protein [Streptomyces flaveus]GGK75633.1 beta-galactosidase [Streptomyces flaveus]